MKKILIVDDEPHIVLLIEETLEELEDEGVELLTAENGEGAVEIISDEVPQLVFLDIMMPKMNGFDVCRKIKKEKQLQNVHIVMLTAKGQEFDRKKGNECGAESYVTKPFNPQELVLLSRKILNM